MTATLFLDIDGVLNPFRATNPTKWSREYHKHPIPFPNGSLLRPWVSTEHGRQLLALDVQIVWATTWIWHPELEFYATATGLPTELPRIVFDPWEHDLGLESGNCGKWFGVERWFEEHDPGPFIWVDDLIGRSDREFAAGLGQPHLVIKTDQAVGLRQVDYVEIQKFLDKLVS